MAFSSITLSSWTELQDYALPGKLYRGQSRASDELRTSLERCCDRHKIPGPRRQGVEDELGREFRRAYHQYARHVPHPSATAEWLSLMQHHGAPTRLLDFTYSIYIATYFAVETATSAAAVWAVDGAWALRESAAALGAIGKPKKAIDALLAPFVEESEAIVSPLFFEKPVALLACPLNPFRLNERLRIQKGIFLLAGSLEKPFTANLAALPRHEDINHVLRIVIPEAVAREALLKLFQMNITRTALFPGLDGYSKALGVYHPTFEGAMLWNAAAL